MLRSIFYWSFFFTVFLFKSPSQAQENGLNFLNISSRHGLSSNHVTSILKDRHGYLWFGTNDGLNQYDGKNFTVYRHREDEPNSILSNEIRDLYEDNAGNLWIGTGSGLTLFNRKLNTFIHYNKTYSETVISIGSSPSGGLWLGTYDGLLSFDPSSETITPVKSKDSLSQQTISASVVDIFKDRRGCTWLATNHGLFLYLPGEDRFLHFYSSAKQNSLVDDRVRCVTEDRKGNIWIGTENGLSMMEGARRGKFLNYRSKAGDKTTISSNIVYSLASGEDGKLWLGTERGITILNPATGHFQRVEYGQTKFGFQGKAVKALHADYDNMYWIGTDRAGVFKYDKNLTFFNLRNTNPVNSDLERGPVVTAFEEAEDGQIYIGTDGGGISLFNLRTGDFNIALTNALVSLKGKSILAMEKAGAKLWIGTFLEGVFVFDTETKTLRQFNENDKNNSISGNDIFCLKQDRKGNVWIGTNGQGVNWFSGSEKKFYRFEGNEKEVPRALISGFIRSIDEDSEGNMWIGTSGSGIIVYNPATAVYRTLNRKNSGLPKDQVNTVYASRSGSIWVGMTEGGLALYDKKDKKFRIFSEKNGLASEVIYKIIEDDEGTLWLSTNKGVSSFNPATRKFRNYSHDNGLQQGAFVLGAGIRTQDGTIMFGGTEGFNYLQPKKNTRSGFVPEVVFTDLRIGGKNVVPGPVSEIKEHISIAKEIEISYGQNFSISFAALNFSAPQDNRYVYKLEKFDKAWIDGGNNTNAVYTNLDPGRYVFYVKAMSAAGDWVSKAQSVNIYVRPPIWRTSYAYIIYIVLAALGFWYLRKRALEKLKAEFMLEQERRESECLREFDQMKIKFLTNLSHEFRTPISLIMGPVEQLLESETDSEKSNQLGLVRRNAQRLLNLVTQLLDFRNLEQKELKLSRVEGDFVVFTRDIAESFKDLAERKRIDFCFHSSLQSYYTSFDADKIERILFNLLSNAFKFTGKGGDVNFYLSSDIDNGGILIDIEDNGIGIAEEEKEKIFTRFYQKDLNDSIGNQGNGIGLSIAREFVTLHGGTIDVESSSGQGSTFNIRLPFKEVVYAPIHEDLKQDTGPYSQHPAGTKFPAGTTQLPLVLIVEDDEDFRDYLKENLGSLYRIMVAADGKEGWKKTLSAHPQIVVSDISMPYINGIDLCKKIRADKRTRHIPVLLLTAITGEEEHLRGLETGASDYMTKPFNFNILNVKIRNLLLLNEQFKNTYSKQLQVVSSDLAINSENEKLLNKAVEYIETNLRNTELSVQDLSKHLGLSRSTLYSKILELSGETPVEFIRSNKLKRAASLLKNSELNIAQVGYAVGFSSPSYFAQAFKAYFNMAPSEYLQLNRKLN